MDFKEQSLVLDLSPDLPDYFYGDRAKLKLAVSNLLFNANKYSPSESRIHFSCGVKNECLYLSVKDSGIGIAASERERIFLPFERLIKDGSVPGNGLGLSIAKTIVELHQGSISVESFPGEGSTFTVVLPAGLLSPNTSTPNTQKDSAYAEV